MHDKLQVREHIYIYNEGQFYLQNRSPWIILRARNMSHFGLNIIPLFGKTY